MARGLRYTRLVIRRRLSWQLTLVLLLVSLVPLVGAGFVTLRLVEESIREQVSGSHRQLARVSGAMVESYVDGALAKLANMAAMLKPDEDPREQARRLNGLVQPPDIFLGVTYHVMDKKGPVVKAVAQQDDYNNSQYAALNLRPESQAARPEYWSNNVGERLNRADEPQQKTGVPQSGQSFQRAYDPQHKQVVQSLSASDPILSQPRMGNKWTAETIETIGAFPVLPISVPATGGGVLSASLDFRPLSQALARFSDFKHALLVLVDRNETILAASRDPGSLADYVEHMQPLKHAGWHLVVREPREVALAPLHDARLQIFLWFGLACVMAVGLAALFAGRVLRPVRALALTADALGRGDFTVRTGIERPDEIGQLAQAFDRMATAVQELDRLKGEFVAHVSHELRTPLTSAKVAIANVQEGLAGKEALGRVQQDLDRLVRMVNELLDAARIEAGIALAKQATDLGLLVRGAVETLRPIARVPLEVAGAGATLEVDPARVQQIVVNLVDNALKYAKSRVEVKVDGREVRVMDDGPGVPPEHRERIFERFSKVETGPKPPGAGLGLSIARKLSELHGGSLVCEGNTFVLKL
jgi:signal transduction histidine kinase